MTVLITNVWIGVPFFTVLLYSALQDVPGEILEAARIDGAGPWQRLIHVKLPVIRPVIEVVFVLGFVFTIKVFDVVIGLTQGGPANSTQLIGHLGLQPVVPGLQLRPGRGAEHRAAADRAGRRTRLHLAQPGNAAGGCAVRRRYVGQILASIAALAALVVLLFPLYAVIIASFETNTQLIAANHYNFFPPQSSLSNYSNVLSTQGGHVLSSLIIGLGTMIITLLIALPAAHALARYRFRVTGLLVGGLLIAQILPSIVIANSMFILYHKLHLLNSYPGLILADASYAVPFSILVLRAFMLSLPRDVLAAARVDGASEWRAFTRVVLPMSRSAIITVALFAFLNGWGDFIFALTLLNGNTFEPITLSIYTYVGEFATSWGRPWRWRGRDRARRHAAHRRATLHRGRPDGRVSQGIRPRISGGRQFWELGSRLTGATARRKLGGTI